MRQLRHLTCIFAILVAGGLAPAQADGPPASRDRAPRYAPCCDEPVWNWSGLYLGGHGSLAFTQADWDRVAPVEGFSFSDTTWGGGVQLGFQRQWERMVLGAEVSYTWLGADDSIPSVAVPGTTISTRTNDLLLITGKLGYAQDRWLAYAKAGWASAEIDLRSTTGGLTVSSSGREHGWTMGIGIDYAVTNRMLLGVAYDWSFFSLDTRTVGGAQFDGSEDIQNLTARLTFLLGGH